MRSASAAILTAIVAGGCTRGLIEAGDMEGRRFILEGVTMHLSMDGNTTRALNAGHTLEVRDGRLLLDGADLGPTGPGEQIRMDGAGRVFVNGVQRAPTVTGP